MYRERNIPKRTSSPVSQREVGGWRVKAQRSSAWSEAASAEGSTFRPVTRRRGYDRPLPKRSGHAGVFASFTIAILGALLVVGGLSTWFEPAAISQPAHAETGNERTDGTYKLHLGIYESELGAKLTWTSIKAYPGKTFDEVSPNFESRMTESLGPVYLLTAGHFVDYDNADSHCDWLRDRRVACTVVDG